MAVVPTHAPPHLVLASQSPQRKKLLTWLLRRSFTVLSPAVDETPKPHETAVDLTRRLAALKAEACLHRAAHNNPVVIAADTVISMGGKIYGKPHSDSDGMDTLKHLSGKCHNVVTGVCIRSKQQQKLQHSVTQVWFRPLQPQDYDNPKARSEAINSAGAYAIQGYGGNFVTKFKGSLSGIIGLPVTTTANLLSNFAVATQSLTMTVDNQEDLMVEKTLIHTDKAPAAIGPYSQGIDAGPLLFLSGQIGMHPDTMELVSSDVAAQTHRTLENLAAVAKAGGGSLQDAVKLTVWLVDLNHFQVVNKIMAEYFNEPMPARACVEVSALPKGAKVEIEAVLKSSSPAT